MNPADIRLGVVGLGSIGRRHLRNLAALGVRDLIATDVDPARERDAASVGGARWAPDLDSLLGAAPDAVIVCTPSHLHTVPAVAAIEAGAHVLIEKPLATRRADAEAIVDAARHAKRVALVACNMRFHPGVATLKSALERGGVGNPVTLRAYFGHYLPNWRPGQDYRATYSAASDQGGGIMMESVHEIDYLRWMAGDIRAVASHRAHASDLEIEGEDVALMLLEFESGAIGEIRLDYLRYRKSRGCEVIGTEGVLEWVSDGRAPERILVRRYSRPAGDPEELYADEAYDGNDMYRAELEHFLKCVAGEDEPLQPAADAKSTLEIALAASEQAGSWGRHGG